LLETDKKSGEEITDTGKICEILDKLEPLLINKDIECLNLLDEVYSVSPTVAGGGAKELGSHMEEYNFRLALKTLKSIKKEILPGHE